MRRAFTLMEVLVTVAIIAFVVAAAFVGVGTGQSAARLRGATRGVYATIRQARSVALVTQHPAVVTYANATVDGQHCVRVTLDSVKLMDTSASMVAQTVNGETIDLADPTGEIAAARAREEISGEALSEEPGGGGGETVEDILFAEIDADVMTGLSVKVLVGDEAEDDSVGKEAQSSTVSAFSNVDSLLGRFAEAKGKSAAAKAEEAVAAAESEGRSADDAEAVVEDEQSTVSVAWEPNGRCQPHRVWIYEAGKSPESGLEIAVDAFGTAKVVSFEEDR